MVSVTLLFRKWINITVFEGYSVFDCQTMSGYWKSLTSKSQTLIPVIQLEEFVSVSLMISNRSINSSKW